MTVKKQDLIGVIATRAKAIDFWSFMHYLPNPDPVLKKMGKDISAYREILSDSHVGGCVRRRKAAIKGLEWRITPTGNEKTDEILTALFDGLSQRYGLLNVVCEVLLNRLLNVNNSKQNTNCNKANTAAFGKSNSNKIA